MLRRDIFRAGLAGAAGLFGLRQASAATGEDRLKVAYHLSDADRVNFVLGNIKNHYEGTGGNVEIVITEIESEEDAPDIGARARFVVTRAQARAMAVQALEVVAAGRPRCQFCGYPLEPDGHICPAMNGHRSYQE